MSSEFCRFCYAPASEGAQFCGRCGEALTESGLYEESHYSGSVDDVKRLMRENRLDEAEKLLLKLVDATEDEARKNNYSVAPWYYERLAVLYRKKKDTGSETKILERYATQNHGPNVVGAKEDKLITRLEKLKKTQNQDIEDELAIARESKDLDEQAKTVFEHKKTALANKYGIIPPKKLLGVLRDTKWGMYNRQSIEHVKRGDWGLHRNVRLSMAEQLEREGKLSRALEFYFEVCYLDINGPNNGAVRGQPRFDPSFGSIVPGVVERIQRVIKNLEMSQEDARGIFLRNERVQNGLKPPVSVSAAWNELEPYLFPTASNVGKIPEQPHGELTTLTRQNRPISTSTDIISLLEELELLREEVNQLVAYAGFTWSSTGKFVGNGDPKKLDIERLQSLLNRMQIVAEAFGQSDVSIPQSSLSRLQALLGKGGVDVGNDGIFHLQFVDQTHMSEISQAEKDEIRKILGGGNQIEREEPNTTSPTIDVSGVTPCKSCGESNSLKANFCHNCGSRIKD